MGFWGSTINRTIHHVDFFQRQTEGVGGGSTGTFEACMAQRVFYATTSRAWVQSIFFLYHFTDHGGGVDHFFRHSWVSFKILFYVFTNGFTLATASFGVGKIVVFGPFFGVGVFLFVCYNVGVPIFGVCGRGTI